ncbi:hypothetical protein ACYX34_11570 [Nitrospira sp. CMX1]
MAEDVRVAGMSEVPPGSGRAVTVFAEKCVWRSWSKTDGLFEQRSRAVTSYLILLIMGELAQLVPSITYAINQERTSEDRMITAKGQFLQLTWTALTFVLVLGALSMIWPSIMALFVGLFLLLRSCHAEQSAAVL